MQGSAGTVQGSAGMVQGRHRAVHVQGSTGSGHAQGQGMHRGSAGHWVSAGTGAVQAQGSAGTDGTVQGIAEMACCRAVQAW